MLFSVYFKLTWDAKDRHNISVSFSQGQKLISSLDIVLVGAWKDFIEHICSKDAKNVG